MSKNGELKKLFQELYKLEKQAHDLYGEYLSELNNEDTKNIVLEIQKDEERHMEVAKQLINIADED